MTFRTFIQAMYKTTDEPWSYAYAQGYLMQAIEAHHRGISDREALWRTYREVEQAANHYSHLLAEDPSANDLRDRMLKWALRRAGGGDSTPADQADPR